MPGPLPSFGLMRHFMSVTPYWLRLTVSSLIPLLSCPVLRLVERGDLIWDNAFSLSAELPTVLVLAAKYADRPTDIADACLVRMTELAGRCKVGLDRGPLRLFRLSPSRQTSHPLRVPTCLALGA